MSRLRVVLHRPIYARNIGMCARAMANMGADQLILIAPEGEINEETRQGAAHAQEILRGVRIYPTLSDFHAAEGEGIRIALSGRDGLDRRPGLLTEAITQMRDNPEHLWHQQSIPIYLIFGPEDYGLSNEEMALCHHVCRLPTFGKITSLNISHAVLLTSYLVRSQLPAPDAAPNIPVSIDPLYYPSDTIQRWLAALGFDLSAPRVSIEKTLNKIFLSRCPSPNELRVLENVLQQTIRKLKRDDTK